MCYDTAYLRFKREKYQKHKNIDPESINPAQLPITFHVSGFSHPDLPVITKEDPTQLKAFEWGLIPFFMKDPAKAVQLSNKTLNARGETIFEKPSYKASAKNKRCAILLDNFYEHHHSGTDKIPYKIGLLHDEPFWVGGLYSHWNEKTTVSIITTSANALCAKIHNGGSNSGRMPFIIPDELLDDWLNIEADDKASKDHILAMIGPYDPEAMQAYTVGRLRGKYAIGNKPKVLEKVEY